MTGDLVRLAHRDVVLQVGRAEVVAVEQAAPAQVDEPRGQVEVGPVPGHPVQLDQRGLDLRVPVDVVRRPAEPLDDQVREAPGDRDELSPTAGPRGGDGGLDEVARAVQLVAPVQLLPRASRLDDRERTS